jgi:hypothetical protein
MSILKVWIAMCHMVPLLGLGLGLGFRVHLLCSMCYLELPRVLVNNRSINKTLQSLRNTCTRQKTAYSKRKVTKLWEDFPRFSNSKRALCNRKVFFRLRLPIDAKEENVYNGLAWVLSLFLCLGSRIPEQSEIERWRFRSVQLASLWLLLPPRDNMSI